MRLKRQKQIKNRVILTVRHSDEVMCGYMNNWCVGI